MRVEKNNFTVKRMARLLEVSRSGFYAWSKRKPSDRAVRQERIEQKVLWFHGDSDEVSGSPEILVDLRDDGPAQSVEFRHHQGVPGPQILQHVIKGWPLRENTRGVLDEDLFAPGGLERIGLTVEILLPGRNTRITNSCHKQN